MSKRIRRLTQVLIVLSWLLGVVPVTAQPARAPRGQVPPARPPAVAGLSPAEVQRWFDAYILVQAQQALSLTDEQYAKFVGAMRTLQDTRRRHQQERARLVRELARLSAQSPVDEQAIGTALTSLRQHDANAAEELSRAYAAVDAVLTPRQQARFRVFEENMERRKLELVLRARQRQAARGRG